MLILNLIDFMIFCAQVGDKSTEEKICFLISSPKRLSQQYWGAMVMKLSNLDV